MISFRVDDMTCNHCVATIKRAVKEADPGASVDVELATHLVRIEPGAAAKGSAESFAEAIREAGYSPAAVLDGR